MRVHLLQKMTLPAVAIMISFSALAQLANMPRNPSPAAEVSQTVGISKITINYSRPHVTAPNGQDRSGAIWGQQVPYGLSDPIPGFGSSNKFPWRAGANENTVITFTDDVKIGGKDLAAGSYGLFLLVEENGSATWILSKNTQSWGSFFYDEKEDALRVTVQSEENEQTPRLTYNFIDVTGNSATVALDWEKKRFPMKVEFDVHSIVVASMANELRSTAGFTWQSYNQAANYCLNNNVSLEQGLKWAETSIANTSSFTNMSTKSQLLGKLGREAEAKAIITAALEDPSATEIDYYNYGRQLIGQDKDQEAMAIFEKLNKKWPDHWLAPHGLARGYSALGDYKKALKYERVALEKAPSGSKVFLEGFVKTLEEGKDFN